MYTVISVNRRGPPRRAEKGTRMNFIVRWLVTAVAVGVAVWLVPGIAILGNVESWFAIIVVACALSAIDLTVKPILQFLSLPITILTLGIFYLVLNTVMLYLAAWLGNTLFHVGFTIAGFGSAFIAAIIISVVSAIMNAIVGND